VSRGKKRVAKGKKVRGERTVEKGACAEPHAKMPITAPPLLIVAKKS